MKVLYLALSTAQLESIICDVNHVVGHGGEVVIITTKPEVWPELPAQVRVIGLAEAESAHWFVRAERLAVFRLPSLLLRAIRKLLVLLARVVPAPANALRHRVETLMVRQRKAATRWHKHSFANFYRNVRPFVLWRVARSNALRGLDVGSFDEVIVADSLSTALGWQMARASPQLSVGFDLVRERS